MLVTPRISEKAYMLAQSNSYVFNVPLSANKSQVADAIAAEYNVKVTDVRLVVMKGKAVRAFRGKKSQPGIALRQDKKKAYVRLAEGNSINVFNEEETK